jgi:hypothetical protein
MKNDLLGSWNNLGKILDKDLRPNPKVLQYRFSKSSLIKLTLNHFILKVPIIFTTKTYNIKPLTSTPLIPTETYSTSEIVTETITPALTAS